MTTIAERKIRDVRDIWHSGGGGGGGGKDDNKENPRICCDSVGVDSRSKHKYKTLERHLSMKKTIRKKMMRDLREIGDAGNGNGNGNGNDPAPQQSMGFLEQIRTDQPPSANIDKPSLWKRLTKGWSHS